MKNLGFYRDNYNGDLIIQFIINYPKNLTQETIEKLKEIL